jgi:hypothetical protein
MLSAVRAYDPDHVVTLQATLGATEEVHPGAITISFTKEEDDTLSGTDRAEFIDAHRDDPVDSATAEVARTQVVQACSPHRRRMSIGEEQGGPPGPK